jgi:PAS domain S-box-containing protein
MLCAERTLSVLDAPKIQIFATDIDEAAITVAREGFYTINDAADVPPERLRRFFNKEGDGYRIRREIREMIMFANHNFIKDPPFSHLDLISCRNVLIYLNHTAQERVMETFHFALNPGGFLFLGSSESADGASDLYMTYNREYHIFQTRHVNLRAYPVPESVPTFNYTQPVTSPVSTVQDHRVRERIGLSDLHQRLLEEYAPPSVVVNEEYEILHLSERAGKYLQIAGGEPSQNLLKLVRQEMRLELRSALYQAVQRLTAVEARGLKVNLGDHVETINIHVRPVLREGDVAKGFILVIFERTAEELLPNEVVLTSDEPVARQLEEELMRLKAQLRASIEQHEFQAEELKASNEELQAMNEELRSAAEELETSKEELQSINEELRTVNQELKVKVEETTMASNNLQNLINSVDIGTIFLDRSFRVAFFTPPARSLFNLIPNDIGRPLSDITNKLEGEDINRDAEVVLERLHIIEREVKAIDGRLFMMRVLPYRTEEDRINGVVITFFDITERKNSEEALRQSEERYRHLFTSIDEAYALCEIVSDKEGKPVDFKMVEVNPAFEKVTGVKPELAQGKTIREVMPGIDERWIQNYTKAALEGEVSRFESRVESMDRWFDTYVGPAAQKGNGKFAMVFSDITKRKQTEEALRESEARQAFLLKLSDELRQLGSTHEVLQRASRMIGEHLQSDRAFFSEFLEDENFITVKPDYVKNDLSSLSGKYKPADFLEIPEVLRKRKSYHIKDIADTNLFSDKAKNAYLKAGIHAFAAVPLMKDNKLCWTLTVGSSSARSWDQQEISLMQDVVERAWAAAERVQSEEALRKSEGRFRAIVSQTAAGICNADLHGKLTFVNKKLCDMLGYEERDLLSKTIQDLTYPEDLEKNRYLYEQIKQQGVPFDIEKRLVQRDGSLLWVNVSVASIRNRKGDPESTVMVIQDMTERKALERQKDEFIGIASHELKTPVTSIKAYGEILQARFEKLNDSESKTLMEKLNSQVDRLTKLIKTLLDTTKIVEGKLPLRFEKVDMNAMLTSLVETFHSISEKHELIFTAEPVKPVIADAERIEQVASNMIANAIKYSSPGTKVWITTHALPDGVEVRIKDQGIGIPPTLHQKVFDRFFRGDHPDAHSATGMGLGLYICAGIVQRHGGSIGVESEPGRGSTFYFVLPFNGKEPKNEKHN